MNSLLVLIALALCAVISAVVPNYEGMMAVFLVVVLATPIGLLLKRHEDDKRFLLRVFIGALMVRMIVGLLIFLFRLQGFFGPDALTYDNSGFALSTVWRTGEMYYMYYVVGFSGTDPSGGWGMHYGVAAIYYLIGRNMLAVQFVNAVLGAATAPVVYICARHIFNNRRVARVAALLVGFYPSLVLWSSQGLKDGPIVFLIAFSMMATLKLGEKLSFKYIALLSCSLFALLTLRFYVFYMVAAAIGIAFVIGMKAVTAQSLLRQVAVVVVMIASLAYLGVARYADKQIEQLTDLQTIDVRRKDLAASANSGFAKTGDVSTASGALSVIPIGLTYLLFAPFPWQMGSLRQMITLPEMLVWWTAFPLMILGLWYSIKFRLRQISPILIFTVMLTLAYSVFQGNVGTAYRQRAQILIFYFIFVAVGFVLMRERSEDRKQQQERRRLEGRRVHPVFAHRRSSQNV